MNTLKKIADNSVFVQKQFCAILIAIMLAITFSQVVMRYVFSSPFIWSDELSIMILVWFGFFAISGEVYTDSHMSLEVVYNMLSPGKKKVLNIIRHLLLMFFASLMIYYGIIIGASVADKHSNILKITKLVYYLPMIISGISIFFYSTILLINTITNNEEKVSEHV